MFSHDVLIPIERGPDGGTPVSHSTAEKGGPKARKAVLQQRRRQLPAAGRRDALHLPAIRFHPFDLPVFSPGRPAGGSGSGGGHPESRPHAPVPDLRTEVSGRLQPREILQGMRRTSPQKAEDRFRAEKTLRRGQLERQNPCHINGSRRALGEGEYNSPEGHKTGS